MPLLSSKLPNYSGEYGVGVVDIEVPIEKRIVANAVFQDTGKPAFELETLLFSLYYPAAKGDEKPRKHHKWVANIPQHGEGYARVANIDHLPGVTRFFTWALWSLVGSTTIPADVDAPLHGSTSAGGPQAQQKFPVIILSHGTVSNRTSYTAWCGELASRGYLVAAVEHRDGSGPGTEVLREDGTKRDIFFVNRSMLQPEPETDDEFKAMQLAFRQAEVEETVRILKLINAGAGDEICQKNLRKEGKELAGFEGRLNEERFVVAGHSYGATLALQALKGCPSEERPFVAGIALDPGKSSGPLNDDIAVPLLVLHSQSWSSKFSIFMGRPHFEVVQDLVRKVLRKEKDKPGQPAWFLTSKGTTHPSVTDAPLIEPFLLAWTTWSSIDAREGVLQYVMVCNEFMHFLQDGRREGVLAEDETHAGYDEDIRSEERKAKMCRSISKYWQIHISPPRADAGATVQHVESVGST
ncbi:PAF-acetylhydrolase family member [Neohortaea acidophila]|uniref:Putative phospholipase n=1 Tax=Neohortaea acidophila TaxID=245834 RepID=A0A6A6PGY2_9PEZI|nr:PAF-acetylhydrolase family member [Neohortaea acidophila]KAF2479175.1 PAF-acetylhydrolase family member [Neohortaea acidophila]